MDVTKTIAKFYDEHGKAVRLGANAGVYIVGAVVLSKTTTLLGIITGAALVVWGSVGLGCSVGEFVGDALETRHVSRGQEMIDQLQKNCEEPEPGETHDEEVRAANDRADALRFIMSPSEQRFSNFGTK